MIDRENDDDVSKVGVTPVMHYDPLGRLVKTKFPDDTFSKVEFTAWEQWDYDCVYRKFNP